MNGIKKRQETNKQENLFPSMRSGAIKLENRIKSFQREYDQLKAKNLAGTIADPMENLEISEKRKAQLQADAIEHQLKSAAEVESQSTRVTSFKGCVSRKKREQV